MKKSKFKKRYVFKVKTIAEIVCHYGYLEISDELRIDMWNNGHPHKVNPKYRIILERVKG